MPYKFKGSRACTQKSGEKGKYLTIKKDGTRKCYKSKDNYKSSMAWGHGPIKSGDEREEAVINESVPMMDIKFTKEHLMPGIDWMRIQDEVDAIDIPGGYLHRDLIWILEELAAVQGGYEDVAEESSGDDALWDAAYRAQLEANGDRVTSSSDRRKLKNAWAALRQQASWFDRARKMVYRESNELDSLLLKVENYLGSKKSLLESKLDQEIDELLNKEIDESDGVSVGKGTPPTLRKAHIVTQGTMRPPPPKQKVPTKYKGKSNSTE